MNLDEAKKLFFKLRAEGRIDVCEEHVIKSYPERKYSIDEVIGLIKAPGVFQDTTDCQYRGERFYWRTKDIFEHSVRLVVEFEEDEDGQLILVISAGERA